MRERLRALRRQLANISATGAALAFLIFGLGVAVGGYVFTQDIQTVRVFVEQMYANLGVELVSIGLTVLVIDRLNRRRAEQERKEELILQMGSDNNTIAKEATRVLKLKTWLTDGSLHGAYLGYANLQEARLGNANLRSARLVNVNLQGAGLFSANLQEADLSHATLLSAYLWDANLQSARLVNVNLQSAYLVRANLQSAYLDKVNLQGANLSLANLHNAFLYNAEFDESTILPDMMRWKPETDLTRFTDPQHPEFWRSDNPDSPAYRGDTTKGTP
jgi:hypothetical protein